MDKKVLVYILLGILLFAPLYACNQHIENPYEDVTQPFDSIKNTNNPSDTTSTTLNRTDTIFNKHITSDTISVAHWNIGNFALGKSSSTSILADESKEKAKLYHAFLDTLNLDVLGICEYDPTFSKGGEKAKDAVFDRFPYYYIGKKYSYNCNAVFCKEELNDCQDILFKHRVQTRYYAKLSIRNRGIDIIFIETHLDWNQGDNGTKYRKTQITDLVETFKDNPYVIICADYNTSIIDEFKPFVDAGFTLANGGVLGTFETYPALNPKSPIDNIIVKGFNILDVKVIKDDKLSDHCLIKCVLHLNR